MDETGRKLCRQKREKIIPTDFFATAAAWKKLIL
jgi:hypothetical protein